MNVARPIILFLYAESPVHWGTGASVGVVDLPIQRERHTDYPTGQSSGIKGALRSWFEARHGGPHSPLIKAAFGPEAQASDHAGCVAFADGRLILFPVRSLRGTFAYCTSRHLLARLDRDLGLTGERESLVSDLPLEGEDGLVADASPLRDKEGRVVLEEYPLATKTHPRVKVIGEAIGRWTGPSKPEGFWRERIASHLCIVPDDLMRDLVRMATTIETHVRIGNDTGTADEHGLFYEELLPSDSVLYCPIYVTPPLQPKKGKPEDWPDAAQIRNVLKNVDGQRVQMGAGATSGRGIVLCRLLNGGTPDA